MSICTTLTRKNLENNMEDKKLPDTWEKYLEMEGIDRSDMQEKIISLVNRCANERLLDLEYSNKMAAMVMLVKLRDCYRRGWKPDGTICYQIHMGFNEESEITPYVAKRGAGSRFLSFPTYDLAMKFLENFRDLILTANDLI